MTAPIPDNDSDSRPTQFVVLHIPHSSVQIPPDERRAIYLNDAALDTELLRMRDSFTNELFPATRLVCDVERFPSDDDEPMTARGMGVSYVRTSFGDVLRARPDVRHRQAFLDRWYWPHHTKLERAVNDVVTRSGLCLIVDCHSFASVALPYELDQTSERADICVGTDPFHTPSA